MEAKSQLGKSLKALRAEQKITQDALAKELNITVQTVSHWETGYTEPSIAQLIVLADFFSVSLDDLVGREIDDYNTSFILRT